MKIKEVIIISVIIIVTIIFVLYSLYIVEQRYLIFENFNPDNTYYNENNKHYEITNIIQKKNENLNDMLIITPSVYDTSTSKIISNNGAYGSYTDSSLDMNIPEASYRTNLRDFSPVYDTMESCSNTCAKLLSKSKCEIYNGSETAPIIQCGNSFISSEKQKVKCMFNEKKGLCQTSNF